MHKIFPVNYANTSSWYHLKMIINIMCILNIPLRKTQKKPRSLEHPLPCGQDTKSAYYAHYALKWQMTMTLHIYRPRRFQRAWFGVNRPGSCWVPTSARFQGPLLCRWPWPLCPHGQMTKTLHIYRPRQLQRTWFGVNHPSGCWVPASARFQEPLLVYMKNFSVH